MEAGVREQREERGNAKERVYNPSLLWEKGVQFHWDLLRSVPNTSQNCPCKRQASGAFIHSRTPLLHCLRVAPANTDSPQFQALLAGWERALRLKKEQYRTSAWGGMVWAHKEHSTSGVAEIRGVGGCDTGHHRPLLQSNKQPRARGKAVTCF